jgi:hypothetical protein
MNWGLATASGILDSEMQPRDKENDGKMATVHNKKAPKKDPAFWSLAFTRTVYRLSKITVGEYRKAMDAIAEVVKARHENKEHKQRNVKEAITQDIDAVVKEVKEENVEDMDEDIEVGDQEDATAEFELPLRSKGGAR